MAGEPRRGRPKERRVELDADGVPIDPNDWTVEDWRLLWEGMRAIKAMIAERHRPGEAMRARSTTSPR